MFALSPARGNRALSSATLMLFGIVLAVVIGLRDQVGADWYNYTALHDGVNQLPSLSWLIAGDPAYNALNRLFDDPAYGIYLVNCTCALFFTVGAIRFARDQPQPALALTVLLPYLGIVVAMGYTRQSVAIGLFMFALVDLRRGHAIRYFLVVALAVLFHRSALIALPLGLLKATPALRLKASIILVVAAPALIIVFLAAVQSQFDVYVVGGEESGGGGIRVALCVLAALIFLLLRRRMRDLWPGDADIWIWCSYFALALLPLLAFASTAADRMGLYLVPLQIAVGSRLSLVLQGRWRAAAYVGTIALYGCTLVVWLTTSFFAQCCWIPYRWVL